MYTNNEIITKFGLDAVFWCIFIRTHVHTSVLIKWQLPQMCQ
jgi:hypothetical protein